MFAYLSVLIKMPVMLKRILLALSLSCFLFSEPLAGQLKLGQWRTHLPYKYCSAVEVTDEKVFCAATGGLFSYGLEDRALEKLSKVDGLSDNGVSLMRWDSQTETLVLVYENANIDIIRKGTILNLPDIKKKQIPGDKTINDIYFLNHKIYLSTGFGIVVIDLDREEFRDTYTIGDGGEILKVNQVSSDGTWIYAATDKGLRRGLLNDPFLVDFNAWERLSGLPGEEGVFNAVVCFQNRLLAGAKDPAGVQDKVLVYEDETWSEYPYMVGRELLEMIVRDNHLTMVDDSGAHVLSNELLIVQSLQSPRPRSAALDKHANLWLADWGNGLYTNTNGRVWRVMPNGPYSSNVVEMAASKNHLYSVLGGTSGSWGNLYKPAIIESFVENKWSYKADWSAKDLFCLAVDPSDPGHVFAGSWGYGLFEFRDGEQLARYMPDNSSLQSIISGGSFVRIGGLAFDDSGNLWMNNSNVPEPISVLKPDGSWKSFDLDNKLSDFSALHSLLFTQTGHIWMIVARSNGLFAMDTNGTPDDESDDVYKRFSVIDRNGKVITNDVRCFAEDHQGNIWLGTNQGVLVIYSPWRLFHEEGVYAQEVLIPKNDGSGNADVLLGDMVVSSIAVDGANRKWLGTEGGGVFLVSDDGQRTIATFNAANSPLLSDNIIDICVNGVSGEVFFGTDAGIISYMGEAHDGSRFYENVVVYPNPVREGYEGKVAIKGLVEETTVKITDISGNIVFETESLGGQALWDGTNFAGQRVATGVYLIFLSNSDGSQSHITKLLFIH